MTWPLDGFHRSMLLLLYAIRSMSAAELYRMSCKPTSLNPSTLVKKRVDRSVLSISTTARSVAKYTLESLWVTYEARCQGRCCRHSPMRSGGKPNAGCCWHQRERLEKESSALSRPQRRMVDISFRKTVMSLWRPEERMGCLFRLIDTYCCAQGRQTRGRGGGTAPIFRCGCIRGCT